MLQRRLDWNFVTCDSKIRVRQGNTLEEGHAFLAVVLSGFNSSPPPTPSPSAEMGEHRPATGTQGEERLRER